MKNLQQVEVFHIETTDEGMFAHISYRDTTVDFNTDLNLGQRSIRVPIKPRAIQFGVNGGQLVDQSEKNYQDSVPQSNSPAGEALEEKGIDNAIGGWPEIGEE